MENFVDANGNRLLYLIQLLKRRRIMYIIFQIKDKSTKYI